MKLYTHVPCMYLWDRTISCVIYMYKESKRERERMLVCINLGNTRSKIDIRIEIIDGGR